GSETSTRLVKAPTGTLGRVKPESGSRRPRRNMPDVQLKEKWILETRSTGSHQREWSGAADALPHIQRWARRVMVPAANEEGFLNTSTVAMMVFQLRVVTGTPKIPSIIPKKPMVFMWRR